MPLYEYRCNECQNEFSETLRIKEHERKKVRCPKCRSADVRQIIEPLFAITSSKT